jgi:hypothetical protein
VTQIRIRDVANKDPTNFEDTLPLIGCPNSAATRVINRGEHFCHTAEVTAGRRVSRVSIRHVAMRT